MTRFAHAAAFAALALLSTACDGELAPIDPPESMPGCEGEAWCAVEEACYLQAPSLALLDDELTLDYGFQGGVHVDLPLQLTGHVDGEPIEVTLLLDGEPLGPLDEQEQSYFYIEDDACNGTVRWLPSYQAEARMYRHGTERYTLIVRAGTWRGAVQSRYPIRVDI